ncbi:predicted protein [Lichtheimia corymbifera JMRC:FSU:9682]|uniref:Uncharacterized protein n=1 Tax=Lichtheimia corymbifera JMRC:FSU:9682 TaxID=1263082 RepID=A0A068RTU7_9FUNG|nr:predicted protein [Lichtheimia corymbifera JMRC:FSU:9682]
MDDAISPAIQALFALLSYNENDQQRDRPTHGWKRKHIYSDHRGFFLYGWIYAIKCSNVESWNTAFVTWRVVSRNDELYLVDAVEDDDGLDGMDKRSYIFDERRFTTMDDIATLKSMHATSAISTIMDEDAYDDSNREYYCITRPADSM